jgi:hypothetical protein
VGSERTWRVEQDILSQLKRASSVHSQSKEVVETQEDNENQATEKTNNNNNASVSVSALGVSHMNITNDHLYDGNDISQSADIGRLLEMTPSRPARPRMNSSGMILSPIIARDTPSRLVNDQKQSRGSEGENLSILSALNQPDSMAEPSETPPKQQQKKKKKRSKPSVNALPPVQMKGHSVSYEQQARHSGSSTGIPPPITTRLARSDTLQMQGSLSIGEPPTPYHHNPLFTADSP